jgi:hypothetical protein
LCILKNNDGVRFKKIEKHNCLYYPLVNRLLNTTKTTATTTTATTTQTTTATTTQTTTATTTTTTRMSTRMLSMTPPPTPQTRMLSMTPPLQTRMLSMTPPLQTRMLSMTPPLQTRMLSMTPPPQTRMLSMTPTPTPQTPLAEPPTEPLTEQPTEPPPGNDGKSILDEVIDKYLKGLSREEERELHFLDWCQSIENIAERGDGSQNSLYAQKILRLPTHRKFELFQRCDRWRLSQQIEG